MVASHYYDPQHISQKFKLVSVQSSNFSPDNSYVAANRASVVSGYGHEVERFLKANPSINEALFKSINFITLDCDRTPKLFVRFDPDLGREILTLSVPYVSDYTEALRTLERMRKSLTATDKGLLDNLVFFRAAWKREL